ncbi:50S ribosomal protein L29 [Microbacterium elymi]|uniref:50S ribosomal protein L29 n=1 Tax=Microbacterium elymi TaxID=2909587 RepID=UPI00338ED95C
MAIGTKELATTQLDTFEDQRLLEELRKAKEELFNLRFQSATGQAGEPRPHPCGQARHRAAVHRDPGAGARHPCHPRAGRDGQGEKEQGEEGGCLRRRRSEGRG